MRNSDYKNDITNILYLQTFLRVFFFFMERRPGSAEIPTTFMEMERETNFNGVLAQNISSFYLVIVRLTCVLYRRGQRSL